MPMINLGQPEIEVLRRSVENCLRTCHKGGLSGGCPDCQSLEAVMTKFQ
ncbi:MAG: hypothetical protein ACYCVD_16040 [Desulfitobacteriaceae bacterium]